MLPRVRSVSQMVSLDCPSSPALSPTFALLLDQHKRAEYKGLWARNKNVGPSSLHSAFLWLKKPYIFAQMSCRLKLLYGHEDIRTLLSLQYHETDGTVTSLLTAKLSVIYSQLHPLPPLDM